MSMASWWDNTPVDLFFNTTDFHEHLADRIRHEPFLGGDVPFLACRGVQGVLRPPEGLGRPRRDGRCRFA
jgi:hypothetical protein